MEKAAGGLSPSPARGFGPAEGNFKIYCPEKWGDNWKDLHFRAGSFRASESLLEDCGPSHREVWGPKLKTASLLASLLSAEILGLRNFSF